MWDNIHKLIGVAVSCSFCRLFLLHFGTKFHQGYAFFSFLLFTKKKKIKIKYRKEGRSPIKNVNRINEVPGKKKIINAML